MRNILFFIDYLLRMPSTLIPKFFPEALNNIIIHSCYIQPIYALYAARGLSENRSPRRCRH